MNSNAKTDQATIAKLQLRRISAQISASVTELDEALLALETRVRKNASSGKKSSRA